MSTAAASANVHDSSSKQYAWQQQQTIRLAAGAVSVPYVNSSQCAWQQQQAVCLAATAGRVPGSNSRPCAWQQQQAVCPRAECALPNCGILSSTQRGSQRNAIIVGCSSTCHAYLSPLLVSSAPNYVYSCSSRWSIVHPALLARFK